MAVASDFDTDLESITAEELIAIRRIRARAQGSQLSEYRKALLARCKETSAKRRADIKIPGDGKYQTYRLAGGLHIRYDLKDIQEARESSKSEIAQGRPPLTPPQHIFKTGDLVTPETDEEALMMDQDPGKFRPMGPTGVHENVDELMAEVNRLKALESRVQELDTREKEIARREEELKKKK